MTKSHLKAIYVQHGLNTAVKLVVPADRGDHLTTQWLFNETIKELKAKFPTETCFDNVVALQTANHNFAIDYWLTQPNKPISVLKNETILKPFFKQPNIKSSSGKVSLDDFIIETRLGYGAFSRVYLVRKKDTGMLYALKQIKKSSTTRSLIKIILRERQAMLDISSSHVIKLRYAFQTKDYCYLVQDFYPGGDLRRLLDKRKLNENEVRFFVVEAILGLNAIHGERYIYRDLKPENLLLDLDGHICIADLGLAKKVKQLTDLNYSVCGTSGLLAPEIQTFAGYDCAVDYYNIGTLTYELATGKVPVFGDYRVFVEKKNPGLGSLSADLKDFIKRLLETNPEKRLGAGRGLSEICAHPWLSKIDMSKLVLSETPSPCKIDMNSLKFKDNMAFKFDPKEIEKEASSPDPIITDSVIKNFSFYGREDSLTSKIMGLKQKYAEKSVWRTLNKAHYQSTPNLMGSSTLDDEDEDTTVPETHETIGNKLEKYSLGPTKTMKKMKFYTNWGKMRKEHSASTTLL